MRLETYNSQLIEIDKQCSHKKGVMLQCETDLENVKNEIHDSNAKYKNTAINPSQQRQTSI